MKPRASFAVPAATLRICAIAANPALDRVAVGDDAALGGLIRATSYTECPGGKATHAAAVAVALGAWVELVLPLGGERGRRVTQMLRDAPIGTVEVPIAAETRGTYTLIDSDAGDVAEIIEISPTLEPAEVAAFERAAGRGIARADVVIASGSLPGGVDDEFYAEVVRAARRAGAFCVIDARGPPLEAALAQQPDLITPNVAEAAEVIGDAERSPRDLADRLLRRGARRVWLTLGPEGSLYVDRDQVGIQIASLEGAVVCAVGCGDAMLGGFAAGWRGPGSLSSALSLGAAAAADKLSRPHPSHIDPARTRALAARVALISVSSERGAAPGNQ